MAEKELTVIQCDLKVYPGVQMTAQDFAEMFEWALSLPADGTVLYGCLVSKASATSISVTRGWICHKGRLIKVNAGTATIPDLAASTEYHVYIKTNLETGVCTMAVDTSVPTLTPGGGNASGTGIYYFALATFTTNSNAQIDTITKDRALNSRRIYEGPANPGNYGLNGDIFIKYSNS